MTSPKTLALFTLFLASLACSAQQKFPLRPGEWTASITSQVAGAQPITMLYCMNDETWQKAISGNASCAMKNLILTPMGGSYSVDCSSSAAHMTGDFKVVFDGMTHMTSSGSINMTMNGNAIHKSSTADFHWKGPTCNPAADINLRNHNVPPPPHQ
jgi:hypothetical protein